MSAPKIYNKHGVRIAKESTYGSQSPALSNSTDGILCFSDPEWEPSYADDGKVEGDSTAAFAGLPNVQASGLLYAITLPHYFRSKGSAYASSSEFSSVHVPLQCLGMSATFSTNKWDYALIDSAFPSFHGDLYSAGEFIVGKGGYMESLEIAAAGMVIPKFTFKGKMIGTAHEADGAPPAIVYPYTTQASPKATGITLTLTNGSGFTGGKPVEFTHRIQRAIEDIGAYQTGTANEHGGMQPGIPTVELDVVMRATTMGSIGSTPFISATEINPFRQFDAGIKLTLAMTVGSGAGARWKLAGTVQYRERPKREKKGEALFWSLPLRWVPPDEASALDYAFTTD
jgi:hypothetical protein